MFRREYAHFGCEGGEKWVAAELPRRDIAFWGEKHWFEIFWSHSAKIREPSEYNFRVIRIQTVKLRRIDLKLFIIEKLALI